MPVTYRILEYIIELGPIIIIPALLLIISLIIDRKPLENLKNCIFIFIGLTGVSILLTLLINFFEPIINTILVNSPKEFETIDAGWLVGGVTGSLAKPLAVSTHPAPPAPTMRKKSRRDKLLVLAAILVLPSRG